MVIIVSESRTIKELKDNEGKNECCLGVGSGGGGGVTKCMLFTVSCF